MIVGGTSIKEWELKFNKKRIPEYLIKDPKFIIALINEVGDYVEGNSVSCLSKLKETHGGELKLHLQLWHFLGLK